MKKQIDLITTFKTPTGSRWNYTDADRVERKEFEQNIMTFLEMPDNWEDYFEFSSSSDFLTLKEKKSYDFIAFRRFKRGKDVTIPTDLKERLLDFIDSKDENNRLLNEQKERETNYENMLAYLLGDNTPENEWHCHYFNERDGLNINLMGLKKSTWRDEMEYDQIAKVYIRHTGEIIPPNFSCHMRYAASIGEAKEFIEKYQPIHDKIMAKAEEIKSQLPETYFVTKKQPA